MKRHDGHYYISLGRRPGAPKWVPGWCRWWVGGATVCPRGLLPGRVLQRFVEQIIDEDGVVLAVVDVPVICSDKFLQFLFFGVEVPRLQFIDSSRGDITVEITQVQFLEKVVDVPVVCNDRCRGR